MNALLPRPSGLKLLFPPVAVMPRCSSAEVFIWDAVKRVGKALLPDEWDGSELFVLDWPISPFMALEVELNAARHRSVQLQRAAQVLRGDQALPGGPEPDEHVRAWQRQPLREQQEEWEKNDRVMRRLATAWGWLDTRLRDGIVEARSAYVEFPAAPVPMEASEWFVADGWRERLIPGRYSRLFLNMRPPRQFDVYLFIDAKSLDSALSVNAAIAPGEYDGLVLPPGLQLLFDAVKQAQSKGTDVKADSLKSEIEAAAGQHGIKVTPRDLTALAKVLRASPEK